MPRILLPLPCLMIAASAAAAGEFHALSLPGSQLAALSADGHAAAGGVIGSASGGFCWHQGESAHLLERAVSVRAMSASGRYVAGSSLDAQQREVATWWDSDGTLHALGGMPGAEASAGLLSQAWGITDEPQVVGVGAKGVDTIALRWTKASGWQALDDAPSVAIGISGDGHRTYGWRAQLGTERRGAVWEDGVVRANVSAQAGEFVGANRAATILLGIDRGASPAAWRWTPSAGRTPVTAAPTRFNASDDHGNRFAGVAGSGAQRVAMIWTRARGVERLRDFLAATAIDVPEGWTLLAATALSADGHRIGGFGLKDGRFDSFIVDLGSAVVDEPLPPTAR
jgi:hypothetical protein